MEDRRFIVTEKQLLYFLEDRMKLRMLENDGVDNWSGYGRGFTRIIQSYYPEELDEDEIVERDINFRDTALAIIDSGEYPELVKQGWHKEFE